MAKQCASYIIKELRRKYLGINHINAFLDEEYELGNPHRRVFMTLISNNVVQDLEGRNNNVFLFGNLYFHNLIVRLELCDGIIGRIFRDRIGYNYGGGVYIFGGVDWYRINGHIVIGVNGNNNVLNVRINGSINNDIIDCGDPHIIFKEILSELYDALGISTEDVVNVGFESGHISRMGDKERSNFACTDINELNQRNDNKRSLMPLGLIGYSDMCDYSDIKKCDRNKYVNYEVHFFNYDNRSSESILDNIDYLFYTGDRFREEFGKIFPNHKDLAVRYNAIKPIRAIYDYLESLGIKVITPFEITAMDNYLKMNILEILELDDKNYNLYNVCQKWGGYISIDNRIIKYLNFG